MMRILFLVMSKENIFGFIDITNKFKYILYTFSIY